MYFAASIHDFDHPGVNNNFLIATNDKWAMLYNDKSVLENHHCAAAFDVLMQPENNFLGGVDKKVFKTFRASVVDLVLVTDLAQHFVLLSNFKKKVLILVFRVTGSFYILTNSAIVGCDCRDV